MVYEPQHGTDGHVEVVNQYNNPKVTTRYSNQAVELPYEFPEFRRPNAAKIKAMVPAIARRARLDQDPFKAIEIMYECNRDKIYKYVLCQHSFMGMCSNSCTVTRLMTPSRRTQSHNLHAGLLMTSH